MSPQDPVMIALTVQIVKHVCLNNMKSVHPEKEQNNSDFQEQGKITIKSDCLWGQAEYSHIFLLAESLQMDVQVGKISLNSFPSKEC